MIGTGLWDIGGDAAGRVLAVLPRRRQGVGQDIGARGPVPVLTRGRLAVVSPRNYL